ncbi:unnamed protein product [Larinioides sclopetarius]|uniref:Thyroglobulin type-1 domain-containing protein n=1 Tax=Larinioides sclopetarius TaxID=280406 RepID=A0AAV2AN13_9ARAC
MNMHRYVSLLLLVFVISFAFANGEGSSKTTTSRRITACELQRKMSRENALFVPECDENGDYHRFQCVNYTSPKCFCIRKDGLFLSRAKKLEDCE